MDYPAERFTTPKGVVFFGDGRRRGFRQKAANAISTSGHGE
jgi:hypothetical protein